MNKKKSFGAGALRAAFIIILIAAAGVYFYIVRSEASFGQAQ